MQKQLEFLPHSMYNLNQESLVKKLALEKNSKGEQL